MVIRPTTVAILVTLLLPPAIYVALAASSASLGLLPVALCWIMVGLVTAHKPFTLRKSDAHRLTLTLGAILLLTVHVTFTNLQLGGVSFARFFSSCAFLLLILTSTHFAAEKLMRTSAAGLISTANQALVVLTLLGLAAAAGAPAIGPQASSKAVVIFGEPSHFALAYLPMLLFRIAVAKRANQFWLMGCALLLALLLQSLTMLAGIFIVSALFLRRAPLVLMVLVVAIGAVTLDVSYYSDRLRFSSETDNLSVLVFLQGWQNAILNFQETHGLGVGFQQFGIAGSIGDIAEKIAMLVGEYMSLLDGGSTATKLIAEFGVAGLLILVAYMTVVVRGIRFIRKSQLQAPAHRDPRRIFLYALVVSYSFELLIRGLGYFSPGGFLAVAALIALHRNRAKTKSPSQTIPETSNEKPSIAAT